MLNSLVRLLEELPHWRWWDFFLFLFLFLFFFLFFFLFLLPFQPRLFLIPYALMFKQKSIYSPNDLLDSSEDEEMPLPGPEKPQDVLALLRKWLDLDSPELSEKMVDFLLQEGAALSFTLLQMNFLFIDTIFSFFLFFFFEPQKGALEAMLDQIILINKNIKVPASYKSGSELPYRARDYSNAVILKRSYNAMEMLSGNAKSLARLLQPKFRLIG